MTTPIFDHAQPKNFQSSFDFCDFVTSFNFIETLFLHYFLPISSFEDKKCFSKISSSLTNNFVRVSGKNFIRVSQKKAMIQFQENSQTDERTDRRTKGQTEGQKNRETLFYRALLATAGAPKSQLQ